MNRAILTIEVPPGLKVSILRALQTDPASGHRPGVTDDAPRRWIEGFTLIELMIVVAIIATLCAIAIPNYINYRYKAQIAAAIAEIRILEEKITNYIVDNDDFPDSLNDIGAGPFIDPWGRPYVYLKIAGVDHKSKGPKDKRRKDHNMVPVNSDYDLYSMGRNGDSRAPFTAKHSRDDIVRANDGQYVGLASDY